MYSEILVLILNHVLPLLYLAIVIIVLIRLGFTSSGILIASGFGLLFLSSVFSQILHAMHIDYRDLSFPVFKISSLLTYLLIFIGLILVYQLKLYKDTRSTDDLTVRKLSKGFYLSSVTIAGSLIFVLSIAAMLGRSQHNYDLFILSSFFVFLSLIYYLVVISIFAYKIWSIIPPEIATTTPGKAVGFLFIPFYNLYWIFVVYPGWAKDYNLLLAAKKINLPVFSVGLPKTIAIFTLLSMIPYLGILFSLINIILVMVFISKACNSVNALTDELEKQGNSI